MVRAGTRLRTYLVALVAVTLLPVLALSAYLSYLGSRQEAQAVRTGMVELARALSLAVDREIGTASASLNALAASAVFQQGDYAVFRQVVETFLQGRKGWISVVREDGQQLLNTRLDPGAALPRTDNHEWLRDVFGAAPLFISNAVTGPVVRQPFIAISLRVPRPDQAVVLTLSIAPEDLSKVLLDQRMPAGWYGVIADRADTIIGRTQGPEFFGQPMTVKLEPPEGVKRAVTHEGDGVYIAWATSVLSGWSTGVAAPAEAIDGLVRSAVWKMTLLGGIALLIALFSAALLARRLTRPLASLAEAVTRPAIEDARLAQRSGIFEFDALADAFRRKVGELQASIAAKETAQADLRNLNDELEARILERTREIAELSESLTQAQKLEAIGRLTGGFAHDFNNLLTAIQGNLELLGKRVTDERLTRYIANARAAGERGAQVTAQLLAFSRRQRLAPKPVDVNACVQRMSDLLGSTLGGTIRLEAALDTDVPLAMADPTQLELIILNLAINARDAMPTGGVISIQTSTAALAHADRPEEPPSGEYVVVAVADTGTGMTEEVRSRAFEPFFTTKEIGKGSGLGLPQVLGVAKQLGGGIRIQTESGRGTRVEVYLPYAKSQALEAFDPAVTAAALPELSGIRVLLVDDDPDVRAVAAAMLTDLGCTVSESASGAAGIDALNHGGIDVVVIDYAMPGMNGVDAARAMSRDQPHVPILLVTGYADPEALAKSWTGRVLRKPFDIDGLAAEIGHCLAGRLNVVRLRRM